MWSVGPILAETAAQRSWHHQGGPASRPGSSRIRLSLAHRPSLSSGSSGNFLPSCGPLRSARTFRPAHWTASLRRRAAALSAVAGSPATPPSGERKMSEARATVRQPDDVAHPKEGHQQ